MAFHISFGGIALFFLAVVGLILLMSRASGSGGHSSRGAHRRSGEWDPMGSPGEPESEARLMQEIHASLTRMDQRVEVLETILMDKLPRE